MDDPTPTFRNWKDRVTYLLGEYRVPISITIFGGGLWAIWARPQIPAPPEPVVSFILAWTVLAIPTYLIGLKIVDWIYSPDLVRVAVIRPGNDRVFQLLDVPPDIWDEAIKLDDADPMPIDEGAAYAVTEYEWLEDIRELRIRGCEPEMLNPGDAYAYHEKVDRYYDKHVDLLAGYSKLKAVVAELIQTGHDDGLMQAISATDSSLAPNVSARELLEEVERKDGLKDPEEFLEWEDLEQEGEPMNGENDLEEFADV